MVRCKKKKHKTTTSQNNRKIWKRQLWFTAQQRGRAGGTTNLMQENVSESKI
jgi:hypothetical protein